MSSNLAWVWVVGPHDIADALDLPLLTVTDTLHFHYKGRWFPVRGVGNDRVTMYAIGDVEKWIATYFEYKTDELTLKQLSEKSIPIARELTK